jgi:hypothetical protein
MCPIILPGEADAMLIVDWNPVLTDTVALRHFQPISWRGAQIAQADLSD